MNSVLRITLTLCLIGALGACSKTKTVRTEIFDSKTFKVDLTHETVSGGKIVKKGYRHPVQFTPEVMMADMQNLRYADPTFLWKEKERNIFTQAELDQLVPQIVTAFSRATPDELVSFYIRTWKKDLVFGSDKITSGVVFIDEHGMNWAFANCNLNEGPDGDVDRGNPLVSPPTNIRLSPQGTQDFYRPTNPSWYEAKVFTNWIIEPNPTGVEMLAVVPEVAAPVVAESKAPSAVASDASAKLAPAKPAATATKTKGAAAAGAAGATGATAGVAAGAGAASAASGDDSVARLRRLKSMLDEKLISPQDYEIKKKEILKDL